jgi:hypothetical protein
MMNGTTGGEPTLQDLMTAYRAAVKQHDELQALFVRYRGLIDPHFGAGSRREPDDELAVLEARADRPRAERDLALAKRDVLRLRGELERAQQAERARILAERGAERAALVDAVMADADRLAATVGTLAAHDAETRRLTGSSPGDTPLGDFPAKLKACREALTWWESVNVRAPAPPPARGKVRLRLLGRLFDRPALQYRNLGDVADFDPATARDLVNRKIAVEA